MLFGDLTHAREPDSRAFDAANVAPSEESVEHPRNLSFRNTDARIGHAHNCPGRSVLFVPVEAHGDRAALGTVLERVGHEVYEYALEPFAIPYTGERCFGTGDPDLVAIR